MLIKDSSCWRMQVNEAEILRQSSVFEQLPVLPSRVAMVPAVSRPFISCTHRELSNPRRVCHSFLIAPRCVVVQWTQLPTCLKTAGWIADAQRRASLYLSQVICAPPFLLYRKEFSQLASSFHCPHFRIVKQALPNKIFAVFPSLSCNVILWKVSDDLTKTGVSDVMCIATECSFVIR